MSEQELNQSILELTKSFEANKRLLIRQYCDSNNPYKIGDVFTDHIGSVLIESVGYWYSTPAFCLYFGIDLKKDGTPKKSGGKRTAHQCNDITTKKK